MLFPEVLATVKAAVQLQARAMEFWQLFLLILLALVAFRTYYLSSVHINVPTVGVPSGIFGPWQAAFRWVTQSEAILREGVRTFGKDGVTFKVSTPARWVVIVTDRKIIREIKDMEEELSFLAAANERIATKYTLDKDITENPYHLEIISKKLTNKLTTVLPDVVEEITMAFEENTTIGSEWTKVNNWDIMLKCISRTTNRLFIGIPLCRNQGYLDRVVEYATIVSRAGTTIDMFPDLLKPIVSRLVLNKGKVMKKVLQDVGPIFQERQRKIQELGSEWTDRPNDAIQWILECAPPTSTIQDMCMRILFLNFAAIHTSSMTITQVLLDLAAYPEYQEPLKDEIESVLREFGGWTKQALTKMKKLDSVLRESQRMNGVTIGTVLRKATISFALSDGTFLPKGSWLFAPASALHHSDTVYENPMKFDGFRFSRMREEPGQEAKYQVVSTSEGYLPFGVGQHACPGRFFAVNELKVLLAFILCNYEFKLSTDGRPDNRYYGMGCLPDIATPLLFREREGRQYSSANVLA